MRETARRSGRIFRAPVGSMIQADPCCPRALDSFYANSLLNHSSTLPALSGLFCWPISISFKRSYSSTANTTTTGRPCFATATGPDRARSISRPKPYFASFALRVCTLYSAPCHMHFWPFWPNLATSVVQDRADAETATRLRKSKSGIEIRPVGCRHDGQEPSTPLLPHLQPGWTAKGR